MWVCVSVGVGCALGVGVRWLLVRWVGVRWVCVGCVVGGWLVRG